MKLITSFVLIILLLPGVILCGRHDDSNELDSLMNNVDSMNSLGAFSIQQPKQKEKTLENTIQERAAVNISEILGVSVEKITPEARFVEDLGADSLDQVEAIMRIEDEFDIEISDEEAETVKTFQDLLDFLEKKEVK